MGTQLFLSFLPFVILGALLISALGIGGWIYTTRMRIKNGYPLSGAWGQAVYPKSDQEAAERVKIISQENAQLRAELSSIKDRLANVEKIVVDDTHKLTADIEALRTLPDTLHPAHEKEVSK
jgi:hypothetical protein